MLVLLHGSGCGLVIVNVLRLQKNLFITFCCGSHRLLEDGVLNLRRMINLMMVIVGKYRTSCVPSRAYAQWKTISHVLSLLSIGLIVPNPIEVASGLVRLLGHGALVGHHVDLAWRGTAVVIIANAMDL